MSNQFALDLRLARRKAGYTQRDCAHLLGVHKARISALEQGNRLPTMQQICLLSLIYGRSFESLFAQLLQEARVILTDHLPTLPKLKKAYVQNFNRDANIKLLKQRLADESTFNGSS